MDYHCTFNFGILMMISYGIIGLTVLVSFYAFNNPAIMQKFMMNPYRIHNHREYYRFITSGFIHKDHIHLLFNMISFYFLGRYTEQIFGYIFEDLGAIYFVLLYVLAIFIADVPTYFKHRHNPGYNALGASGAVSAVIFAFILFQPTQKICLYFALCFPGFILGALYLIFSYYQGKKGGDNINHDAHLFGALFGIIFCIIIYPPVINLFIQEITNWQWEIFN